MKKIFLIITLFSSLLLAKESLNFKPITPEIAKKSSDFFNLKNSQVFFGNLKSDFISSTGDEDFDLYLENSIQDQDWRVANYLFAFEGVVKEYSNSGPKSKAQLKKGSFEDYESALHYFKESVDKTGNVLSAYQGFRIIEKFFMYVSKNNHITREYLPAFTKVLADKKYCLGYLYYGRTFTSAYGDQEDLVKAAEQFHNALLDCKEPEHSFYKKGIRHENAKAKYLLDLRQRLGKNLSTGELKNTIYKRVNK